MVIIKDATEAREPEIQLGNSQPEGKKGDQPQGYLGRTIKRIW